MSDARSVKYVHLEIIEKGATRASDPEAGLFRGMKTRSETKADAEKPEVSQFIMIGEQGKPNDLKTYNLDAYNIMTLQTKYNDTKELIIFKASGEDQGKALEMLGGLMEDLRKEKRMIDNDPEIVDSAKYKEVPVDLMSGKPLPGATKTFTPENFHSQSRCGFQHNDDWQKKADERKRLEELESKMRWTPTMIKRKGECPGLKDLNLLRKKVAAIAAGDHEYELPKIKREKGEKKETPVSGAKATGKSHYMAG